MVATRPELGHYYLNDDVGWVNSVDPNTVVQAGTRVWFVIDEATGWVAPELRQWIDANSGLIAVLDVMMPGKSQSIVIYLYDPGLGCPPAEVFHDPQRCDSEGCTRAGLSPMQTGAQNLSAPLIWRPLAT